MSEFEYPAVIRPLSQEDGGGFLVEFPDLPGCYADGETIEAALAEARDALQAWLKTAEEFGDEIPKASLAENFSGQWRIRVPKSLHAALALQAKQEGVSLNTLAMVLLAQGLKSTAPANEDIRKRG